MTIVSRSPILVWNEHNIQQTPDSTGVYVLRDPHQIIIYVGRTRAPRRLRERILEHWSSRDVPGVSFFDWYQTDTEANAGSVEAEWIQRYQPPYNVQGR